MMKKKGKLITLLLTAAFLICLTCLSANHSVWGSKEFIEFADRGFASGNLELYNKRGESLQGEPLEHVYDLYDNGDYKGIQSYLLENEYSLGFSQK